MKKPIRQRPEIPTAKSCSCLSSTVNFVCILEKHFCSFLFNRPIEADKFLVLGIWSFVELVFQVPVIVNSEGFKYLGGPKFIK